jgi:hypothetical protein
MAERFSPARGFMLDRRRGIPDIALFFKHGWMIFKWIVTIVTILFGTFFLGPWETTMMEISASHP